MKIILILIMFITSVSGAELNIHTLLTEEDIRNEIDLEIEKLKILTEYKTDGFSRQKNIATSIGNTIVWVTHNLVKMEGWQLTGYSWIRIDEQFRVSRFKIGIINAELNVMQQPHNNTMRQLHFWKKGEARFTPIFGFHFVKEF